MTTFHNYLRSDDSPAVAGPAQGNRANNLRAARELIAERGSAAGMDEIAQQAGVTADAVGNDRAVKAALTKLGPIIWVDDGITIADRRWVQAHHPGKALLHRVDPLVGLTDRKLGREGRDIGGCALSRRSTKWRSARRG
jgi:hypothetical protein